MNRDPVAQGWGPSFLSPALSGTVLNCVTDVLSRVLSHLPPLQGLQLRTRLGVGGGGRADLRSSAFLLQTLPNFHLSLLCNGYAPISQVRAWDSQYVPVHFYFSLFLGVNTRVRGSWNQWVR